MDDLFPPASQEPNLGAKDSSHSSRSAEINSNNNRRLFSSQETPPATAFTEAETAEARNIISPNTLGKAVSEQVKVPLHEKPKKACARRKKGPTTASQPAPMIRAQDGPPRPNGIMSRVISAMLDAPTGDMKSLHDIVLNTEMRLLREND